jgi:HSP20 family protein
MKAFFEKLTGGSDDELDLDIHRDGYDQDLEGWVEPDEDEELLVDVYQDQDNLYIKTFIPGVHPGSLDIDISRDMVTLRGQKVPASNVEDEDYFQRELRFGTFARKILLPREIDIDVAEAHAKDGLLTLTLPKVDKDRKSKLQVRA